MSALAISSTFHSHGVFDLEMLSERFLTHQLLLGILSFDNHSIPLLVAILMYMVQVSSAYGCEKSKYIQYTVKLQVAMLAVSLQMKSGPNE